MVVYNFSAGPATLPKITLKQAQAELLDYHDLGMSVMEINHRGPEFDALRQQTEQDLRDLLAIPKNYHVLFLPGGARTQFAMIPMNLFWDKKSADYINTGFWSQLAAEEAERFGKVKIVTTAATNNFTTIPEPQDWQLDPDAAYVHYTSNATIMGLEFPYIPEVGNVPLVADMSSNILAQPIDVSKFGIIYACAQKNIGPAGVTIVIIRDDLVGNTLPKTPKMLDYQVHVEWNSVFNTPPVFPIYMVGLTLKWLKQQGGLTAMATYNKNKAAKFYQYLDQTDSYINNIEPKYRSQMNIPLTLAKPELTDEFIAQAKNNGLYGLKGHVLTGGIRVSLYNAMPEAGVDKLIEFMQEFERKAHP